LNLLSSIKKIKGPTGDAGEKGGKGELADKGLLNILIPSNLNMKLLSN
jgi:hypothetical protein